MVQVMVVVFVLENKGFCYFVSIDIIFTFVGQEDYVFMGFIVVCKVMQVFENVERILGIEVMVVFQVLDFCKSLVLVHGLRLVCQWFCEVVVFFDKDRIFYEDFETVVDLVCSGVLFEVVEIELGEFE